MLCWAKVTGKYCGGASNWILDLVISTDHNDSKWVESLLRRSRHIIYNSKLACLERRSSDSAHLESLWDLHSTQSGQCVLGRSLQCDVGISTMCWWCKGQTWSDVFCINEGARTGADWSPALMNLNTEIGSPLAAGWEHWEPGSSIPDDQGKNIMNNKEKCSVYTYIYCTWWWAEICRGLWAAGQSHNWGWMRRSQLCCAVASSADVGWIVLSRQLVIMPSNHSLL